MKYAGANKFPAQEMTMKRLFMPKFYPSFCCVILRGWGILTCGYKPGQQPTCSTNALVKALRLE